MESIPPPGPAQHDSLVPVVGGDELADARAARLFTPEAMARRERLTRVVVAVVGVCGALFLVGVARSAAGTGASARRPIATFAAAAAIPAEEPRFVPPPPVLADAPSESPTLDPEAARRAIASAVDLLAQGRVAVAVAAAARATTLDPTDGEGWLVLGAAHEERGSIGEARRCYRECVEHATRGPRDECAALLRR